MDFASLYKNMEEEAKAPDRFKQQSAFSDPNQYKISKDGEGNGTVTVRFIPSFNKDKTQLQTTVLKKVHTLQWERLLPGKDKPERRWKPEFLCPKTFDKNAECPACDYGWDMYNEMKENGEAKEKYDKYRQAFTSSEQLLTNIMIIKDELRPENNGKIFVFKLSKTVYSMFQKEVEKIKEMTAEERAQLQIPDSINVFDPFDLMASKNMVLKFKDKKFISQASDYWGSSYFTNMFSALAKNITEAEDLVNQAFCLDDYISPSLVPSVEQMQNDLDYVLFKNTKKKETPATDDQVNVSTSMQEELMKKVQEANIQQPVPPVTQTVTPEVSAPPVEVPVQQTQPEPVPQAQVQETVIAPAKKADEMSDEEFLKSMGM